MPAPAVSAANRDAAPATGGEARRMEINANITGTGNTEVREGVMMMIQQAFDAFTRDMLPTEVRSIVNDRWGS